MASDLDLQALLAPLDPAAPSGRDLEYDAEFTALEQAGKTRQEQEFGQTLIEGQGPDWTAVWDLTQSLWARTRDLRVAVWMTRCATRRSGLGGAADGLQLLRGLLEQFWDSVHPQLDADDHDDPTARLNSLAPLTHYAEFLADLRAVTLRAGRLEPIRLHDIELALGHAAPVEGEVAPAEGPLREGLRAMAAADPSLVDAARQALAAARAIVGQIEARLGSTQGPDLSPLVELLRLVAHAVEPLRAASTADAEAGRADAPAGAAQGDRAAAPPAAFASAGVPAVAPGELRSRQDAVDALERVCTWIEANEPSHPAPLFIRRAQRLMTKSFIEIIQDLTPEAEAEVRRLAGITAD
jgi:type VI secretion system protein ImpA